MDLGVRWKLHGDGHTPAPGAVVRPDERLSWPRTIGLGAQHVVAMFGASFVAPVLMGLDPNLAIMMSGVALVPPCSRPAAACPATWAARSPSWASPP